jgi:hypothetical protein
LPTPSNPEPGPSGLFRNRWDLMPSLPDPVLAPLSVVVPSPHPLPTDYLVALIQRLDAGFEVEVLIPRGSELPIASLIPDETTWRFLDTHGTHDLGSLRNAAAELAQHEVILYLDPGALPSSGWLRSHADWHARASDLVVIGRRLSGEGREPDWVAGHRLRTRNLTVDSTCLHRYFPTSNVSMRRQTLFAAGGFATGGLAAADEDELLGFRLQQSGAVFVASEAETRHRHPVAWPERRSAPSPDRAARLAQLIAHRASRHPTPGRTYEVPLWDVTVDAAGDSIPELAAAVESVLGASTHDVVVRVLPGRGADVYQWARAAFGADPRVEFGGHPNRWTPFRLELPSGVVCRPSTFSDLERAFDEQTDPAGVLQITVPGRSPASSSARAITARAYHRATRDGATDPYQQAADLSGQRWLSGETVGISLLGDSVPDAGAPELDLAISGAQSDELRELWEALSSLNPGERSALLRIGRGLMRAPAWVRRFLVKVGRVVLRA